MKRTTWKIELFVEAVATKIEKKQKNNTLIQNQQPKIDNVVNFNNNNRTLLFGPSFSGKTYLMLKPFSRMPDRDFYIFTKLPPKQYYNSKIKIKENVKKQNLCMKTKTVS